MNQTKKLHCFSSVLLRSSEVTWNLYPTCHPCINQLVCFHSATTGTRAIWKLAGADLILVFCDRASSYEEAHALHLCHGFQRFYSIQTWSWWEICSAWGVSRIEKLLFSRFPSIIPQVLKGGCQAPISGGSSSLLHPLLYFEREIISQLLLISTWKRPWNCASRLWWPARLGGVHLRHSPENQDDWRVRRPISRRQQFKRRRFRSISEKKVIRKQDCVLLWKLRWMCLTTPRLATFHQVTVPPKFYKAYASLLD